MRARYAWTRSFEVQRPFFIPSWSSAIVISSNRKALALAAGARAGFAVADGFGAAALAGGAAAAARTVPVMRQRNAMRTVFIMRGRTLHEEAAGAQNDCPAREKTVASEPART